MALFAWSFDTLSEAAAAPGADPEVVRQWTAMKAGFGVPSAATPAQDLALYRGGYGDIIVARSTTHGTTPFMILFLLGSATLGYMLLGMAALMRSFLTGAWAKAERKRVVLGKGMTDRVHFSV